MERLVQGQPLSICQWSIWSQINRLVNDNALSLISKLCWSSHFTFVFFFCYCSTLLLIYTDEVIKSTYWFFLSCWVKSTNIILIGGKTPSNLVCLSCTKEMDSCLKRLLSLALIRKTWQKRLQKQTHTVKVFGNKTISK
jgi:hypothetical protein